MKRLLLAVVLSLCLVFTVGAVKTPVTASVIITNNYPAPVMFALGSTAHNVKVTGTLGMYEKIKIGNLPISQYVFYYQCQSGERKVYTHFFHLIFKNSKEPYTITIIRKGQTWKADLHDYNFQRQSGGEAVQATSIYN